VILTPGLSLQAVLSGAVSANQPEVHVDFAQYNQSGEQSKPGSYRTALNDTTDVTLIKDDAGNSLPTAGLSLSVLSLSIYNKDTSSITVTVKTDDGTTERIRRKHTLLTGETLSYEISEGWYATDANGNRKTSATSVNSSAVLGTTTNDDATAGRLGEYSISTVASNTVSLTTATPANITSISLTAGDWDVSGKVIYTTAATTNVVSLLMGISTTSATIAGEETTGKLQNVAAGLVYGATTVHVTGPVVRVSIASTTTVYLVTNQAFTVSTLTGGGTIRARRVR